MSSRHVLILALILFSFAAYAQVGIDNTAPDASAVLDLTSNNKGLLIPRMTTTERQAIASPANSLLVYDTSLNMYFYYSNGQWNGLSQWSATAGSPNIYYNSGSVGIGTSTPGQKLHIKSTSSTFMTIEKPASANEAGINFANNGATQFYLYTDDANDGLKIQSSSESDPSPRMEFPFANKDIYMAQSGGNVGIGTNSPGAKLHINGAVRGNSTGGALTISTTYGQLEFGPMNSGFCHFITNIDAFYFNRSIYVNGMINSYTPNLSLGTNGTEQVTVLSNGNVGIGQNSPTYKLDVYGAVNASAIYVNGSPLSTSIPNNSITVDHLTTTVQDRLHKGATPTQDSNIDFTSYTLLGSKTYSSKSINMTNAINMKPYVRMQMQGMRDSGAADYLELKLQRSPNGSTGWTDIKTVTYRLDDVGWTSCIIESVDTGAATGVNYYRMVGTVTSGTSCNMSNSFTATIYGVIAQ